MVREILRLYYGLHLGKRQISRACGVSPSTVVDYVQKAQDKGISWPLAEGLDDAKLEAMLSEHSSRAKTALRPLPPMEEIHSELRKKGVTLQLLWLEYREIHSEGYHYTQFCEYYHRWKKTLDISLRQEHRAGEKMFLDFCGKTIPIFDPFTGESIEAQIFVAVLGASNYTYVEALPSQSLPFWIRAHIHAFEYYQGVSQILVPDNLRSAVTKACRYEPDLNPLYLSMAQHYGTAIIPARPYKPSHYSGLFLADFIFCWTYESLLMHSILYGYYIDMPGTGNRCRAD